MPLDHEADYVTYLYTCNRCRSCVVDPTPEMKPVCPCYAKFGYFTYSGGGKGYVAQGILEGKVKPSQEVAQVAMNCLLCGACASMCPPGFDTLSFIRDLRDELVDQGIYINEKHEKLLARARKGEVWGKPSHLEDLPVFSGSEDLLVFAGCWERVEGDLIPSLKAILKAAGVSWGVLEEEPCCGAPLEELGDRAAFEALATRNIERLNASGAERILAPCPHCAATLAIDYMNVDDLEAEIITLPRYLDELLAEERLALSEGPGMKVTFHDPCRLGRFMEESEEPRRVIHALGEVDLLEMGRARGNTWCCGSGAWAPAMVPELSRFAVRERVTEARVTGSDYLVTACSYCTGHLKKACRGRPEVLHLVELVAQRLVL